MNIFDLLIRLLEGPPKKQNVRVVKRATDSRRIRPDNTPLYIKRGWTQEGKTYRGYYRTKYGAWKGEIKRRGDKFNVLIHKPPVAKLKKHPKWPCLKNIRGNVWNIHLHINPKDHDVGSIIFYVEKLIIESHEQY